MQFNVAEIVRTLKFMSLICQRLANAVSCLFVFVIYVSAARAEVFHNAFVSFELPDKWGCALERTEWVCHPKIAAQAQKAIIILTAKEVGPSDNLEAYKAHLQAPRTIANRTGQPLQSIVKYVDNRTYNDQAWVDGLHESSEVPSYFTRYVATVKDKIAILVTFSAHKDFYAEFSSDFNRAVQSLRVIAVKSLTTGANSGPGGLGDGGGGPIGHAINLSGLGDAPPADDQGASGSAANGLSMNNLIGIAIVIGIIGLYLLLKRGKNKR